MQRQRQRNRLNNLVRSYTCFESLIDFVTNTLPTYRPTILPLSTDPPEVLADLAELADAFDALCVVVGHNGRAAWRGSNGGAT